jgi:hypothetical protein
LGMWRSRGIVMIKWLMEAPSSGVLVLMADEGIWVGYSSNIGASVLRLVEELKGRATNPDLRVVSANADIETLKLHTEYYRKLYHSELGLKELIPYGRKTVRYRVRMVPSKGHTRIDVELMSARGGLIGVVGRFKNRALAEDFIETYYRTGNELLYPVIACNSDTKELILEEKTKLLDIR